MVAAPGQPGGGDCSNLEEQSHAKQIAHAFEPALPCPDPTRDALPLARDGERALPHARRQGTGVNGGAIPGQRGGVKAGHGARFALT